jgi:hypothetical protein
VVPEVREARIVIRVLSRPDIPGARVKYLLTFQNYLLYNVSYYETLFHITGYVDLRLNLARDLPSAQYMHETVADRKALLISL